MKRIGYVLFLSLLMISCDKDKDDDKVYFDPTGLVEVQLTRNLTPDGLVTQDQNNYDIGKEMCRIFPAFSDTYYYEVVREDQLGTLYEKDGSVAKAGWYSDGKRMKYFTGSPNVGTYGFTRNFSCN